MLSNGRSRGEPRESIGARVVHNGSRKQKVVVHTTQAVRPSVSAVMAC
jgi:hypothetical protein